MYAFERIGEPFVVSGESAKACGPGEASLDHPSSGQQDESSFCHRVLDHFEPYAVLQCSVRGVGSGVALIDKGNFDRGAGCMLDLFGQGGDLFAVALVGRG